jgi:hypothetical protein
MTRWFWQKPASLDASPPRRRRVWIACLVVLALVPAGVVVWNSATSGGGQGEVNGGGVGTREEDANASTSCPSPGGTWDVKIGADSQATQINLTPVPTDIATLTSKTASTSHRVQGTEFTVYTVTVNLVHVYQEHDLDQHMAINDGAGHFMLAELPDTSCAQSSHFLSSINRAHAELAAWSGSTPARVQITGVGFFDGVTNQSDQAPNQIELHPVLDINFNPGGPSQGAIGGTVTDSSGAPVNGASVVTSPASSTGTTNASGQYTIANVGPGSYTVTASAAKFLPQTTSSVAVTAGSTATANVTLTPAPLPAARGGSYWNDWDIARGVALLPDESGGYVLDGFGGLHTFASTGSAPQPVVTGPYWGWDIARGVALLPNGTGGYVVDGHGGIHRFRVKGPNLPPPVTGTGWWPGQDIVRGITLLPNGNGYVLDAYGGMHPFAVTGSGPMPPAVTGPYWLGYDIARGVEATGPHGGYVVDGFGVTHPWATVGATAPQAATGGPYWATWNIARGITGAGNGPGAVRGYVLDGRGGLGAITLWPAP